MSKKLIRTFVGLFFLTCLNGVIEVYAQQKVELRYEIEGKRVVPKRSAVIFHIKRGSFLAKVKKNYFIVPEEISKESVFDVQIVWGGYSVNFASVPAADLKAIWTVGADRPPLVDDSLRTDEYKDKELIILYYLKVDPNDLVGVHTVEVFK